MYCIAMKAKLSLPKLLIINKVAFYGIFCYLKTLGSNGQNDSNNYSTDELCIFCSLAIALRCSFLDWKKFNTR